MLRTIGFGLSTGILLALLAQYYCPEITPFWFIHHGQKGRMEHVLNALVSQEQSVDLAGLASFSSVNPPPRIAIGFGACHDLFVNASHMFSGQDPPKVPEHFNDITTYSEFQSVFAYFFRHGAAAERFVSEDKLFKGLVAKAEQDPAHRYALGGNAPVMALRFAQEGAEVLLAGRMSPELKKSLPTMITVAGSDHVAHDDVHLILEYKRNQVWQQYQSPRANRFIVHSDVNNPMVSSLEDFERSLQGYKPNLLLVSGLQMMDNYPFKAGARIARLMKIQALMKRQPMDQTRIHFEMASFVDESLLTELTQQVIPYADSLGMNEQELPNLLSMLKHGNISYVSNSNPRIAVVLDQMREVYKKLGSFNYQVNGPRPLTRLHVHTLAYQAFLVKKGSLWKNTVVAAAKASLTANRHVCASPQIDLEKAFIIMDDSFSTSTDREKSTRIIFDDHRPVACWSEDHLDIQFCIAPNLVCSEAQQTAGGGDNISAAGLIFQVISICHKLLRGFHILDKEDMSAKAVLVAKANSHPFDDRALILDVPTKIGRSHKDDQAESGNGFFDCKVLSRQHAILMYEDDKFYLMDTGSSNGSFVNNIRLSKSGEESKLTRIYTNDVLRFGSDVVDKQRQITQKCVVMKVRLFYPDGPEVESRPSESRLFRPNDSMEDLSALTQTLQESLSREKHLEDKMIRIRGMISKNIGKTHTDLLRLFENMKQELMNNELNFSKGINTELEAYQKIMSENVELHRRASEQDKVLQEFRHANESLSNQQQSDKIEITSLRKTCQLQKQSIDSLEKELHNVHDELHHNRLESDERYNNKIRDMEQSKKELMEHYEQEITKNEDAFMEERTKIREQLLEVTRNEANLLNRIRCLESEEQYSHAEVEKVLIREREAQESRQKLDIQVEQLKNQLDQAETALEEQKSKIVIQRSEEDIEQIAKLEDHIGKLQHDIAYLKQELLEARARKSASDDELRTIKDKLETLENSITSLTNEGLRHRKQISELNEALEEKSKEADHWEKLVGEMESSLSQDEMTRVQIQDLRDELHGAERNLKLRQDDLLYLKNGIKSRDETIQQLEIDLSCVRGQVTNVMTKVIHDLEHNDLHEEDIDDHDGSDSDTLTFVASDDDGDGSRDPDIFVQNVEEELQITKDETSYVTNIKDENAQLKQRLVDLQDEFNYAQDHANHLTDELARQQILYSELKKMRGRGEEIDQIHEYKQELKALYERLSDMEQRDHHQRKQIQTLEQDRLEMTAEVTETRRLLARNPHLSPAEAAMHTVGNLKVYELILGLLFLFVLFTYGIF
eukprot:TCALIF_01045-PA protein Name:"Similar to Adpgk ADP-dependent glucokinase (Mus musculus)" AED:0.27 eAED:0.27 QI:205/0.53/0.35/0.64/0.92/0.85/14/0/1299